MACFSFGMIKLMLPDTYHNREGKEKNFLQFLLSFTIKDNNSLFTGG